MSLQECDPPSRPPYLSAGMHHMIYFTMKTLKSLPFSFGWLSNELYAQPTLHHVQRERERRFASILRFENILSTGFPIQSNLMGSATPYVPSSDFLLDDLRGLKNAHYDHPFQEDELQEG